MKFKYINSAFMVFCLSNNVFGSKIENITVEQPFSQRSFNGNILITDDVIHELNRQVTILDTKCSNIPFCSMEMHKLYRNIGNDENLLQALVQNDLVNERLINYCEMYPRQKDFSIFTRGSLFA